MALRHQLQTDLEGGLAHALRCRRVVALDGLAEGVDGLGDERAEGGHVQAGPAVAGIGHGLVQHGTARGQQLGENGGNHDQRARSQCR
ncbi:hypothetical protein D3C75_974020 [compost metagenome]